MGSYGSIRWSAGLDKAKNAQTLGAAPLFPSRGDATEPVTPHLADKCLRQAERLAGLESQSGWLGNERWA